MLFTRCPECDTTFRVTDETLKKAKGQVRCGRCASVFNAYAELHDPAAKSFEPEDTEVPRTPQAAPQPADLPAAQPPAVSGDASASAVEPDTAAARSGAHDAGAGDVPAISIADVVADVERAADDAAAEVHEAGAVSFDAHAISATEVDRVLTADVAPPPPPTAYAWEPAADSAQWDRNGRRWSVAVAVALIALAGQAIHHFRSEIAAHATFGPWLTAAYGALGVELAPVWDVHQYQILDWVATAEPNTRGLGSLKITARIQNRGPLHQPYPAVQLRLKDRWEAAVGSRMFTPAEYLPRDTPRGRLMSPGETARAQIEVLDPGPDAYGFELDVCIEVEASLVTCGTDEVFL